MTGSRKWYVVWEGYRPGIYDNWADCELQVKGYEGAKFKSYSSAALAQEAYDAGYTAGRSIATPSPQVRPDPATRHMAGDPIAPKGFLNHSIAVDAACSGNPGVVEYRGVYTFTHAQLFHVKIPWGTNNIGEYLAIVHALALMEQGKLQKLPIYSDSKIAMSWVKQKNCRTRINTGDVRFSQAACLVERATRWLQTHSFRVEILKWDTNSWGEIPADFGRK